METEHDIIKRAETLGETLVVRPAHEQDLIWQDAYRLANGDEPLATWMLRYTLYMHVGPDIWGTNLHIDAQDALFSTEEILEELRSISLPLPGEEARDMVEIAKRRVKNYPWDTPLYGAFIFDMLGQDYLDDFIGQVDNTPVNLPNGLTTYDMAWDFYSQTVGRTEYEWTPQEVLWRITDMINYFFISTENRETSLFTNQTIRGFFSNEMKRLIFLGASHHLFPDNTDEPFPLSSHALLSNTPMTHRHLVSLAIIGDLDNKELTNAIFGEI